MTIETMQAVVYDGPRSFKVMDVARPEPGPGQVRLKVEIAGVCGTDLHIHKGGFFSRYPLVPGHEIVGRVDALGEGVERLVEHQLVAADNTVLCGHCWYCRRGQPLFCRNFYSLGVNGPGAFAEHVVVQDAKCFPVDDLSLTTAVMAEPTACAVHGADVLDLAPGSDALLFGAGPTGLVLAQLLMHGGAARVTVAAPSELKLGLARSYGVDNVLRVDKAAPELALDALRTLAPQGFDAVVEATGALSVAKLCVSLARDGGTVLIYGMTEEADVLGVHPYDVFRRELTIKGSFAQVNCFDRSLLALRTGRVQVDGIVTHRFPLSQFGQALAALRDDPQCVKAAIVPGASTVART